MPHDGVRCGDRTRDASLEDWNVTATPIAHIVTGYFAKPVGHTLLT